MCCRECLRNDSSGQNTNSPFRRDFGGAEAFAGRAHTVRCYENNPLVRKAVTSPGNGRVLVVDGGGSLRCALLGDMLGAEAEKNGWAVRALFRSGFAGDGGGRVWAALLRV